MPTPTPIQPFSKPESTSFSNGDHSTLVQTGTPNLMSENELVLPGLCGEDQAGIPSLLEPAQAVLCESNIVAHGEHRLVVVVAAYRFPASDEVYIETSTATVSDMAYLSEVVKEFKEQLIDCGLEVLKMAIKILPVSLPE